MTGTFTTLNPSRGRFRNVISNDDETQLFVHAV